MGNVYMEATQINYRGGSKKMSVEEAIKAAGTEITPEEKTWIDSIPALKTSKADNDVIAPEFDSEAGVYAIGDLVMHEGKLYEFTTAHETAGEWDSTEVTEKTVADELSSLESGLTKHVYVVGDGVKTTAQLLNELFALVNLNELTTKATIDYRGDIYHISDVSVSAGFADFTFGICNISANTGIIMSTIHIESNNCFRYRVECLSGTWDYDDRSSVTYPDGARLVLYY